jgi:glyceraldehyde 3-phosphate dehydrogenase
VRDVTIKVGINGFGRMGRLGLRSGWGQSEFEMVQINEIATDATGSAHLLKFDSVHGIWACDTRAENGNVIISDKALAYSSNATIGDTDWSDCD